MLHSSQKTLVIVATLGACSATLVLVLMSRDAIETNGVRPNSARMRQSASDTARLVSSIAARSPDASQGRLARACEPKAPPPSDNNDRVIAAKADLAFFATESLRGVLYVNSVLESALALASLPVETHPDFEYEDDDAIAYAITGLPEGLRGHMLVGLQPHDAHDRTCRYLQLNFDMPSTEPEFLDSALRDGPNVNLSISYDVASPSTAVRFALMLQRRVDLSSCREIGIDAYSGVYTQGAYYWIDLLDETNSPLTTTIGIVNGNPADTKSFPGVSPLAGDIQLDSVLLGKLLAQLQQHLTSVKGQ